MKIRNRVGIDAGAAADELPISALEAFDFFSNYTYRSVS